MVPPGHFYQAISADWPEIDAYQSRTVFAG
jgi:hypothetical protein